MIHNQICDYLPGRLHIYGDDMFREGQHLFRNEKGAQDTNNVVFARLKPLSYDKSCSIQNFAHLFGLICL